MPIGRLGRRYSPFSLVVTLRGAPSFGEVAVTVAPGTGASVATSTNRPRICPSSSTAPSAVCFTDTETTIAKPTVALDTRLMLIRLVDLRAINEAAVSSRHLRRAGIRQRVDRGFARRQLANGERPRRRVRRVRRICPRFANRGIVGVTTLGLKDVVASTLGPSGVADSGQRAIGRTCESARTGSGGVTGLAGIVHAYLTGRAIQAAAPNRWAADHQWEIEALRLHSQHLPIANSCSLRGDAAPVDIREIIMAKPTVFLHPHAGCVTGIYPTIAQTIRRRLTEAINSGSWINDCPKQVVPICGRVAEKLVQQFFAFDALARQSLSRYRNLRNDGDILEGTGHA